MIKFSILTCSFCKEKFKRDLRHVNENKKLNQNTYCSNKCLGNSQKHRIKLTCENSNCKKGFERTLGELSLHNFCSHSCSAKVSNLNRQKQIKRCAKNNCRKKFYGNKKYCSINCIPPRKSKYSKKIILDEIQRFTKENNRIPTKKDLMNIYVMARKNFGTWNNAIISAGFKPNPVMFAVKQIANDGHTCDSVAEKIIDDWLYARKISHERSVPYEKNNMTADFKINDIFIEYVGLQGVLKTYDNLIARKEKLWEEKKLKIIKIYPKDLFPKNNLQNILSFV